MGWETEFLSEPCILGLCDVLVFGGGNALITLWVLVSLLVVERVEPELWVYFSKAKMGKCIDLTQRGVDNLI